LRRFHNDKTQQKLQLGAWILDSEMQSLTQGTQQLSLTANEWQLLWYFAQRPHRIITREQLLTHFEAEEVNARAIDIRISRLRKKTGDDAFIETVWGQGYRLGQHLLKGAL
jgi:DNA-binding response OmpR family regulator